MAKFYYTASQWTFRHLSQSQHRILLSTLGSPNGVSLWMSVGFPVLAGVLAVLVLENEKLYMTAWAWLEKHCHYISNRSLKICHLEACPCGRLTVNRRHIFKIQRSSLSGAATKSFTPLLTWVITSYVPRFPQPTQIDKIKKKQKRINVSIFSYEGY